MPKDALYRTASGTTFLNMSTMTKYDVLIVGSGAAGMSVALQLPKALSVAVLSKSQLGSGSTFWAQGGMAAVLHDRDSVQAHVEDTLNAGPAYAINPQSNSPSVEVVKLSTGLVARHAF